MTTEEKIALLEEVFEADAGDITPETELCEIENWDSMTKLSLIVMMDDELGLKLTGDQIREFKTVSDILAFME